MATITTSTELREILDQMPGGQRIVAILALRDGDVLRPMASTDGGNIAGVGDPDDNRVTDPEADNASMIALLKGIEYLLINQAVAAGENHLGSVGADMANASSVLTRPADTMAYAQNDLIASNTTAGSIAVPSLSVLRVAAGSGLVRRFRLYTNKTSGMDTLTFRARFWSAAPTYSAGDNGAYGVATGAAGYLGHADFTMAQFGDGAAAIGVPAIGSELGIKLGSGQAIYWDLQITSAAGFTPASAQTFTMVAETIQN